MCDRTQIFALPAFIIICINRAYLKVPTLRIRSLERQRKGTCVFRDKAQGVNVR